MLFALLNSHFFLTVQWSFTEASCFMLLFHNRLNVEIDEAPTVF